MIRVLIVEDNELNRDMLKRRLQRSGCEVSIAIDGTDGLEKAASILPDVVLLDMSLPDLDGVDVLRSIKANPSTRLIPVIALTAHAMEEDRNSALSLGFDEFDTKPVDLSQLLAKIERLVGTPASRKQVLPEQ
jgi:CheY-like chemotaxis protein